MDVGTELQALQEPAGREVWVGKVRTRWGFSSLSHQFCLGVFLLSQEVKPKPQNVLEHQPCRCRQGQPRNPHAWPGLSVLLEVLWVLFFGKNHPKLD